MAKNPLKNLVPGKNNPIDRNYPEAIDESLPSTQVGITGTNIFDELVRLINERSDRNVLPDGNIFSAMVHSAVEIQLKSEKYRNAHACMIPRDLWNAFADNPGGFSMYKCKITIDFKDCVKPMPDHISINKMEMTTRDRLRVETMSTAYGLFLKEPQNGEMYDVKVLNKTKDFSGDEYIVVDKRAAYDFIKEQTKKQTLASSGAYNNSGQPSDIIPPTAAGDVDALTRTLLVETSFARNRHPDEEFAAICFLAINRAKDKGISLREAMIPPGKPTWNNSSEFQERWFNAHVTFRRQYAAARDFVERLLRNEIPNPIGPRKQLVHPGQLKNCNASNPCTNPRFMCVDGKCLPIWSVSKSKGGAAPNEPIRIGKGIFS